MADNSDLKSLTGMATRLGAAGSDPKSRGIKFGAEKSLRTQRDKFDGFLNAFLGGKSGNTSKMKKTNETRWSSEGKEAESSGQAGQAAESQYGSEPPSRLTEKALDGTEEGLEADGSVAGAAEEAAKIIWDILNSAGSPSAGGQGGPDVISRLSELLGNMGSGGDASLGVPGVSSGGMAGALATANASAEMNQSAVYSALEEMLANPHLTEAMLKTAGQMGSAGVPGQESMAEIAKALEAKIIQTSGNSHTAQAVVDSAKLLAELEIASGRQNFGVGTEKIAGDPQAATAASAAVKNISPVQSAAVAADKAAMALEEGEAENSAGKNYSTNSQSLEKELQSKESVNPGGDASSGKDKGGNQGGDAAATSAAKTGADFDSTKAFAVDGSNQANQTAQASAISGQAAAENAAAAATVLDRIENIQRLADLLKMGSRGNVRNLTMQLAPVELGKVLLKVESKGGVVSATLRVEKAETAAQLSQNLQQLRETLKSQGIEIGELEVTHHAGDSFAGDLTGESQKRSWDSGPDSASSRNGKGGPVGDAEDAPSGESEPATSQSGLNLFA